MSTITWKEERFLQVPLTSDEVRSRGEQLADAVCERSVILERQKAEKERMRDELEAIDGRIRRLAAVVSDGVEERSVPVEVRVNLVLGLLEEIRIDTGEIVKSRAATEEDKRRAQARAQTAMPWGAQPGSEPGA